MRKCISILIFILISFSLFGLVACGSKNTATLGAGNIPINIDEYATIDNETNTSVEFDENKDIKENNKPNVNNDSNESSPFWRQYGSTLIGGGCSIIGGLAGALITVIVAKKVDDKKRKYAYFHRYYKLLFKFKLDLEGKKEVFNLGYFKDCIDNFINNFNDDPDLFFYIYKVYYGSKYKKFETTLHQYCTQFSQENKSAEELFAILKEAVNDEINNVLKILQGSSNDDGDNY